MARSTEMIVVPCGCGMRYPVTCPASAVGTRIACPWSSQPMWVGGGKPFTAAEWDETNDPRLLYLTSGFPRSDRKLRLTVCAIAREFQVSESQPWARVAVEAGEALADKLRPTVPPELIRRHVEAGPALACIGPYVETSWITPPAPNPRTADVLRDQVPNPFVPLEWRREWLTSTVRALAAEIYEKRAFELMPVLGDSLMDAGCDHPLVLEHCRTTKPHARGCWVVDAIRGKT